jgi:hypothetical protein
MPTLGVHDGRLVLTRTGDAARREAAVLHRIAGPGVPDLLTYDDGADPQLVTTVSPPLRLERLALPELTAVVATIAEVLGRAHESGVVHGPLRLEDVQAGPDGVLLSGWHRPTEGTPADDVVELGRLLDGLVAGDGALAATARRAMTPGALTALGLANALRARGSPPPGRGAPTRPRAVVIACVGALVVGLGGLGLLAGAGGSQPAGAVPPPTTNQLGTVVERDGQRWRIGRSDDVVVAGRFDCADEVPALLRPATGQIWTFTSWKAGRGSLAATVAGATSLGVRRDGECDRLEVRDAQGRWRAVG